MNNFAIVGTIRNSVNLSVMNNKWQQKKENTNKNKELTPEEREVKHYEEQAKEIRDSQAPAGIDAKLSSGGTLTPEEEEYLRRNDPNKLKTYEDIKKERHNYKEALKNCDSKEDVAKLKMTKMNQYMSTCKEIANNPNIPKGQKYVLMKKLIAEVEAVNDVHQDFTEGEQFNKLDNTDTTEDTASTDKSDDTDITYATEEVKKQDAENVPAGSQIDISI